MDARFNPYGLLGLSEGDAHVIRNAGGMGHRGARRTPPTRGWVGGVRLGLMVAVIGLARVGLRKS
jgi:hypothetical protein